MATDDRRHGGRWLDGFLHIEHEHDLSNFWWTCELCDHVGKDGSVVGFVVAGAKAHQRGPTHQNALRLEGE